MPEDAPVEESDNDESAKPPTIEQLLSELDEDKRTVIQSQLAKARKEAAESRRKLREAEPLIKAAQSKVEEGKTEQERAQEALSAAEKREVALRNRLVSAEVRALASAEFSDPADAEAFLDLGSYVTEDAEVDTEAIKADLDGLLERKPHLRKAEDVPGVRRPLPDRSQGSGADKGTALNGDPLLQAVLQKLGKR